MQLIQGSTDNFNTRLTQALQTTCNHLNLGVEVVSVVIDKLQPPTQGGIVSSFHKLAVKDQESQTLINNARKYTNKLIPEARARAAELLTEAQNYEVKKLTSIKAETTVFKAKYSLYQKYHNLYSTLAYLDVVNDALQYPKKIIMAVETDNQILSLDLKSEFNPELLDMAPTGNREK